MRQICNEVLLGSQTPDNLRDRIAHTCYLNPHSPESKHECVCGKHWRSYPNVTDPVKK